MADLLGLVERIESQDTLAELLTALGWPVDPEYLGDEYPEIAQGVKSGQGVRVTTLTPFTLQDRYLILLAEFDGPYQRRDLRHILASLRRANRVAAPFGARDGVGDTIFIVATPGYRDVRFVLFQRSENAKVPKIRSFGWQEGAIGRTVVTHNLEELRFSNLDAWEKAWNVEGLTESFFAAYEDVFLRISGRVGSGASGNRVALDEKTKRAWTQLLFNRLLFLAFVERMGWFELPSGDGKHYLAELYKRHLDRSLYEDCRDPALIQYSFVGLLHLVFLKGLDCEDGSPEKARYASLIGKIPYLNGGLFSRELLDSAGIEVPDEAFGLIFDEPNGLFKRFNFTVTESTPLDQEVAVDPEMLGKIFERMVIADERHQTGTYYTPRPIVEFMVNETVKNYLVERGLAPDKAAMLVDEDTIESSDLAFRPTEMQTALDWLYDVRAVDPACGSGAYLLMLLQRLFELVDRLEVVRDKRRSENPKHLYETKLQLLEHCDYGVDKSEMAVGIARLRLWLSLVVENKGQRPEPLPNFDFMIMCGDSLASPWPTDQGAFSYFHQEIMEYLVLKHRYFHPEPGETRPEMSVMQETRAAIAQAFSDINGKSTLRGLAERPFDWEVDFAEVFEPSDSGKLPGFDIVLANPPYVNSGELKKAVGDPYKKALVAAYPKTGSGTADLLVYFFERALQMLRPGGQLAFITSNMWLKAAYGEKLRTHIATQTGVRHLIDFGDLPVFQNVIAYPLITIATKSATGVRPRFTPVPSMDLPYPDIAETVRQSGGELSLGALVRDGSWRLDIGRAANRMARMHARSEPLTKHIIGKIYAGIKTGLNDVKIDSTGALYGKKDKAPIGAWREGVFVIGDAKRNELIALDPRSAEIIKPLAAGKSIGRWIADERHQWLIFTRRGISIEAYPAVKAHLERFRVKLEPRPKSWDDRRLVEWPGRKSGSYKWYEIQDDIAYTSNYSPGARSYPRNSL